MLRELRARQELRADGRHLSHGDESKLRAWWWHRQGLDGSLAGVTAAEVLARSGWARSVGGVGPYLTLFSRAGIGRKAVDEALAKLRIHELPSARGCTYVVPASDFSLALTVAARFADSSDLKSALKMGATEAEIGKLCSTVVKALAKRPMLPEEIRDTVGSAIRNFGPEGKKKGLTTSLPIALGALQTAGEIRRIPTDGRLDQQRYRYALWTPNPLTKSKPKPDDAFVELARRFFAWIGPASPAEFQWFSGLGVKAGKAAIEPLGLVPASPGSDRLMFPADLEAFRKFKAPAKPQYALVSSLDGLFHLRRNLEDHLDKADRARSVLREKDGQAGGALTDLASHAIVDRGRIVGAWEYDPETASIAWASFVPIDKGLKEAVARTEAFVRDDLGDARSFSLDSPKSRAPRIEALRKVKAR